ncbi:MAG: hypothetical protein IJM33_01235 [Bacteroidales bacterium]|nr:hypothetical protein [Bacteroidales bacterium]
MKKNLIFIILCTVVLMSAAQTYDTIYNRAPTDTTIGGMIPATTVIA